ncbi:MAG: lipopolysaccharide biosynthesis protein [Candidatus Altiarchaeota archaeon]|nr:lipopolysaccharide biosynthesis protein [Candidatus Altiarchaeota archaeon]
MGLAEKTVKNFGIVFSSLILLRLIEIAGKIVLIRILTPEDFGLVAIASLYLSFYVLVQTGGLDQAIIYRKERALEAAETSFTLMLVIGIVLYMVVYATAPHVARFFGSEAAEAVIKVLGLSLLLASLAQVPIAIIVKELSFGRDAAVSIISTVVNTASSITLALLGYGYWSLVYGALAGSLTGTLVSWRLCPWKLKLAFDRKLAWEMLGYGKFILLASIATYLTTNIDDISVGKLLGVTALGYYTISFNISNLPATNITHLIGKVMFPTYSKLQDEPESLKLAYLKTLRYVSLLSIPTAFGIMACAHDFVYILFKARWAPIVPFVQILAVYGLVRSLGATTGELFKSVGRPQLISFYTSIILVMLALFVIPVAYEYGLPGVCALVLVTGLIPTVFSILHVARILGIRTSGLFLALRTQLAAGVLSLIPAVYLRSLVPETSIGTLLLVACAYTGSYILLVLLLDPSVKGEFKELAGMMVH